ncbi:MAG: hypothetical protein ACE5OZ_19320 [Candidatus Heimdallarchaeota archaeon]
METKINLLSDEREVTDQLALVSSVYIIKDGVPLFSRRYTSFHEAQDPMLICGFVSAVLAFAETTMEQEVNDIGLTSERLYFLKSDGITYVASRSNYLYKDLNLAVEHSGRLLENIRDSFQLLHQFFTTKPGAIDTTDFESFRVTLDNLVLEQTMELEMSLEGEKDVKDIVLETGTYLPDDYGRDASGPLKQPGVEVPEESPSDVGDPESYEPPAISEESPSGVGEPESSESPAISEESPSGVGEPESYKAPAISEESPSGVGEPESYEPPPILTENDDQPAKEYPPKTQSSNRIRDLVRRILRKPQNR